MLKNLIDYVLSEESPYKVIFANEHTITFSNGYSKIQFLIGNSVYNNSIDYNKLYEVISQTSEFNPFSLVSNKARTILVNISDYLDKFTRNIPVNYDDIVKHVPILDKCTRNIPVNYDDDIVKHVTILDRLTKLASEFENNMIQKAFDLPTSKEESIDDLD